MNRRVYKTGKLKVFISYSSKDRRIAAKLKDALSEFGLECFLAHDNLKVSDEWKTKILNELNACDIFIPLLSQNFKESEWTAQEIGLAISRPNVLVLPLRIDSTLPYGFNAHLQAVKLSKSIIVNEIVQSLVTKFPRYLIPALIQRVRDAHNFRWAENVVSDLEPYFKLFTSKEIDTFIDASIENNQVWDANLCASEYLPHFIDTHRKRIAKKKLKAITYQIEKRKWYHGK